MGFQAWARSLARPEVSAGHHASQMVDSDSEAYRRETAKYSSSTTFFDFSDPDEPPAGQEAEEQEDEDEEPSKFAPIACTAAGLTATVGREMSADSTIRSAGVASELSGQSGLCAEDAGVVASEAGVVGSQSDTGSSSASARAAA